MSLSASSQTVIKTQPVPNSDTLRLHKNVAKKVIKDLVYSDALKQEKAILLENIDTLNNQKIYKDSIISFKDRQIEAYKGIVDIQEKKEVSYVSTIKQLDKQVKRQKLAKKTVLGLLVISIGFLIVK
jgi:hypothetical protein